MRNFIFKISKRQQHINDAFEGVLALGNWQYEGDRSFIQEEEAWVSDSDFPTEYRIMILPSKIIIKPSLFSIYPIYIYEDLDSILISSNIIGITKVVIDKLTISKKFLLEKNLCNYSFSDSTIYNEIKLVPSNTSVEISDRLEFKKILIIEDHFVENPNLWKNNLDELVDLFIDVNENSIKDGDFISFTGGFDGRSLVALGKYFGKSFSTYSFGNESNDDLTLPRRQAEQLGIPFVPINLDEKYIDDFWELGTKLICDHSLSTNLAQVHWYYAAKMLATQTNRLVTGIFGSELFRTFHLPGQFISRHILNMINHVDKKNWVDNLKTSNELKFLNIENFKAELDEIIENLNNYKIENSHLSKNMILYKFGYEEGLRKFFGNQFILPMSDFVAIKTPYLNWVFMKELLKSKFSGVNNDFMVDNPLKRFKGQQFYPVLIKKTFPALLPYKTNKGYSPEDLLTFSGKLGIAKSFFMKRFKRHIIHENLDNLSIVSGINKNSKQIAGLAFDDLYDRKYMEEMLNSGMIFRNELLRDKYLETLTQLIFLNQIVEKK